MANKNYFLSLICLSIWQVKSQLPMSYMWKGDFFCQWPSCQQLLINTYNPFLWCLPTSHNLRSLYFCAQAVRHSNRREHSFGGSDEDNLMANSPSFWKVWLICESTLKLNWLVEKYARLPKSNRQGIMEKQQTTQRNK